MASTPCSGVPLSQRDPITTYDSAADYIPAIDNSEPDGKKLKRINLEYVFSGWTNGDMEVKNLSPGNAVTIYATNSSSVEIPLIGIRPDEEIVTVGGGFRGLESVVTASSDGVDAKGYLIISFDTTSGDITVGGFANGIDRQVIYIDKPNTANNLILVNDSGTAVQKIFTPSGSDITFTHRGGAVLRYNSNKWIVVSVGI